MFKLNLPKADIKLESIQGKPHIWDIIRKKWLVLTPEEYVRQHFLKYLTESLHYPVSLISVERGLNLNSLYNRSDIVVYNRLNKPHILIECKAPQIKITQQTLEQASRYNLKLKAGFIGVTNGLVHAYYHIDFQNQKYERLAGLPVYNVESL